MQAPGGSLSLVLIRHTITSIAFFPDSPHPREPVIVYFNGLSLCTFYRFCLNLAINKDLPRDKN